MASIQPVLKCEIDPSNPVQEICAIISAITPYHPDQEERILCGVKDAIEKRMNKIASEKEEGSA